MLSFVDMKKPSVENTLAPLELVLSVAGALTALALVAAVPLLIFGSGSFLGIGADDACVDAPQSAVGWVSGAGGRNEAHVVAAHHDISTTAAQIRLCDFAPSTSQHVWSVVATAPDFLYALGFLVLAWRLTRTARRRGLFSPHLALGVGRLGLYVLLGAFATSLIRMWGSSRLLATMVDHTGFNAVLSFFHLSWAILFAGFGLLTVGRVMAVSVRMQREIDATV